MLIRASTVALTLASMLAAPAPAPAQQDDGLNPDAIANLLDRLANPQLTAEEVSKQLNACLQPIYDNGLDYAPITIEANFGTDGLPEEPVLVSPQQPQMTRAHLRQLVRAEMAIFDCAPFSSGGSPVADIRLTFEVDSEEARVALDAETPAAATSTTSLDITPAELTRTQRRQAQVRLRLAGIDPGAPDGVFGPRTRDAVSQWQDENGFRPTGQLTDVQVEQLWSDTQTAYEGWAEEQARAPERRTTRVYRGRDGCLRYRANNRIVPGQSLRCDARGLIQNF